MTEDAKSRSERRGGARKGAGRKPHLPRAVRWRIGRDLQKRIEALRLESAIRVLPYENQTFREWKLARDKVLADLDMARAETVKRLVALGEAYFHDQPGGLSRVVTPEIRAFMQTDREFIVDELTKAVVERTLTESKERDTKPFANRSFSNRLLLHAARESVLAAWRDDLERRGFPVEHSARYLDDCRRYYQKTPEIEIIGELFDAEPERNVCPTCGRAL